VKFSGCYSRQRWMQNKKADANRQERKEGSMGTCFGERGVRETKLLSAKM